MGLLTELPGEIAVRSSGRKLLLTLIAFVISLFVFAFHAHYLLDHYSSNFGYQLVKSKWQILNSLNSPVDMIVLGDSAGDRGVDTDFVAQSTDISALNLSTIGDTLLLDDYWMLSEYLKRFQTPRCVLLVHTFSVWSRKLSPAAAAQAGMSLPDLLSYLSEVPYPPGFYFDLTLAKYFRFYSENRSLNTLLRRPWKDKRGRRRRTWKTGWYPEGISKPDKVLREFKSTKRLFRKRKFVVSPENAYALGRILDLSDMNGFKLYLVNAPMYHGLYRAKAIRRYVSEVSAYLRKTIAGHENAGLLFAKPKLYPLAEMEGVDHVIFSAARDYTNDILRGVSCR